MAGLLFWKEKGSAYKTTKINRQMLETRWRLLTGPHLRASWPRRSPFPASSDPVPALCTHRHKTAVIHSSGHSNTHALCTHTGTRQQSSIPQPLEHIRFLHTQAQDCSHLFQRPLRHTCSLHTQAPFTCIILFYWIYRSKTD